MSTCGPHMCIFWLMCKSFVHLMYHHGIILIFDLTVCTYTYTTYILQSSSSSFAARMFFARHTFRFRSFFLTFPFRLQHHFFHSFYSCLLTFNKTFLFVEKIFCLLTFCRAKSLSLYFWS